MAPLAHIRSAAHAVVLLGAFIALFTVGVVGVTVVATGLSVSAGMLVVFLLGAPLFVLTVWSVHWVAVAGCRVIAAATGADVPTRPCPMGVPGFFARPLALLRSAAVWKEMVFACLLGVTGGVAATVVLTALSGGLAGVLLPFYQERLPGDGAVTWLHLGPALESALGVIVGAVLLAAGVWCAHRFADLHLLMARALMNESEAERLRARVSDLQRSRAGMVDAADAERRRIERDLHDGAQQHLVALAMTLGRARQKLDADPEAARTLMDQAHREAKDSIAALRDVVRGVHPAVLTDRGLDAALSALAARSPVPVTLHVDLPSRPGPTAEAVAYFVVSECLTNAAKHAGASRIDVHAERYGDRLLVAVADDGRGGASTHPGGGLDGLRSRLEAVDGALTVTSPEGGGTTVLMEVPCVS